MRPMMHALLHAVPAQGTTHCATPGHHKKSNLRLSTQLLGCSQMVAAQLADAHG
jgi:hypothetical protein